MRQDEKNLGAFGTKWTKISFGPFANRRSYIKEGKSCHLVLGGRHFGRMKMLNNIGLPGLLLIAVVVLVLFGRGKISSLMGEVGKGITSFKKGINEGEKDITDASEVDGADLPNHTDAGTQGPERQGAD